MGGDTISIGPDKTAHLELNQTPQRSDPVGMSADIFSLERSVASRSGGGGDRRFRLIHENHTLLDGRARGRMLAGGAEFHHPDGTPAFTMRPNRRIVPSTWVVVSPADAPALTFRLSGVRRGRTMVTDHGVDTTHVFAANASFGADVARALLLADTATFTISDGERVLAVVGSGRSSNPHPSLLRGVLANAVDTVRSAGPGFHPAAWLSVVDDRWRPSADVIAAYLVFRHQVVDHVRSP